MNGLQKSDRRALCRSWSQMVISLLGCQWKLFVGQYQVGLRLMEVVMRIPARTEASPAERGEATPQSGDEFRKLQRRAAERVRRGLAPPKEIYETPYRERIDWSRFPEWARPSDPELFQGCGHEG